MSTLSDDWMTFILSAPRVNCAHGNIEKGKTHIVQKPSMGRGNSELLRKKNYIRKELNKRVLEDRTI